MKKDKKVLYFAYGSNMYLPRMNWRVGSCKVISKYKLEDYKLTFDYGNNVCTFANIIPHKGSYVEGVIYEITLRQLRQLDLFEGRSINSELFYERYYIDYNGRKLHFYMSNNRRKEMALPLTQEYRNILLLGSLRNKLYSAYEEIMTRTWSL